MKWMAPEAIFERLYSTQSDVWSYGILLWEILTFGDNPWTQVSVETFMQYLKEERVLRQPYGCPPVVYDVMMDCWNYEPQFRPQWGSLVDRMFDLCAESHPEGYLSILPKTSRTSSGYASMSSKE